MRLQDMARLLSLAAIWGGSFIFMKVLAPAIGPFATTDLRLLIAGAALILYFRSIHFNPEWGRFWKHYLIIGIVSSGIPFTLYAFAALHIPSSYSVIINSSTPLFGAVFSAMWLNERLTPQKLCGLSTSALGVVLVASPKELHADSWFFLSVLACLTAAACYGLAGIYIKKFAADVKPMAIAGCSQLMIGVLLLPMLFLAPPVQPVTPALMANILGLSLLCSAVAYLLYYRLIADVGPTKAFTVTFLMPIFGMLWAALFLNEVITMQMVAGCALIILGACLVFSLLKLPARKV